MIKEKVKKMFTKEVKQINLEIKRVEALLSNTTPLTDEYYAYMDTLKDLNALKDIELKRKYKVSPDTLLTVSGMLLNNILALNYERLNVITSKTWKKP